MTQAVPIRLLQNPKPKLILSPKPKTQTES